MGASESHIKSQKLEELRTQFEHRELELKRLREELQSLNLLQNQ